MSANKTIHQLNTVNNAISLLTLFLKRDAIGLVEIEQELGISKTAAFRLVVTMTDRGMLVKDEKTKRYHPGPLLFQLVRKFQVNDVVTVSQPFVQELATLTNESVYISIRTGNKYIYLSGIDSPQLLKVTIPFGDETDLYFGAAGTLHMAFMSPADLDVYFKRTEFKSFTPKTLTDSTQLQEKLAHIRDVGYSTSLGERMSDSGAVAAPIWDQGEEPVATIGVYLPMTRMTSDKQQELTNLVVQYANKISAELREDHNTTKTLP
ncbi:IclR family transcriptional regulator [Sporosarcina sp. FSL K6-1522]|uniref:IclR family transcriptional regulator n=1 Tax=Sporosarcina sp. FSL K6-1522 TaxID=2921554 RepID=UPI003159F116